MFLSDGPASQQQLQSVNKKVDKIDADLQATMKNLMKLIDQVERIITILEGRLK